MLLDYRINATEREGLVSAFTAATCSFELSKHKVFQSSIPTQLSHMQYPENVCFLLHHR